MFTKRFEHTIGRFSTIVLRFWKHIVFFELRQNTIVYFIDKIPMTKRSSIRFGNCIFIVYGKVNNLREEIHKQLKIKLENRYDY